jgi:hypothetical protein
MGTNMKIQRLIIVWVSAAVACVGASITAAQVPPAPYNPPPPQYNPPVPQYTPALPQYSPPAYQYGVPATGQVTAKNPLLLALVLQPLLQQTGASASSGIGMLFSRLFNALFGHKDPNSPPGAQYPGGAPYGSAAAGYPPSTPQYGTPYPGTPGGYPAGVPGSPPTAFGAPYGAIPATPYGAATPYPSGASGPAIPSYGSSTPTPYPTPAPGTPAATNPAFPGYPPAPGAPATTGAYAGASSSYTGAPPPGLPTTPGAKAAVLPSVLYSLEHLDPKTFKVSHSIDLGHGTPTLHTGDVFAIEYSTNVPGQVRIDNVDSTGTMSALGTYTVQSGHDNRIPVTKGMKLIGTTGTETFKLYFFPCLPTDAGGTTDSAAASAGLPTCPPGPSPQLLRASTGLLGAKAAVNLDSPDPTIAVNAFASYQTNDVTESDFQILHVAPGAASGAQSK